MAAACGLKCTETPHVSCVVSWASRTPLGPVLRRAVASPPAGAVVTGFNLDPSSESETCGSCKLALTRGPQTAARRPLQCRRRKGREVTLTWMSLKLRWRVRGFYVSQYESKLLSILLAHTLSYAILRFTTM